MKTPVNDVNNYQRLAQIASQVETQEKYIVLSENFGKTAAGVENPIDVPTEHTYKRIVAEINKTAAQLLTDIAEVIIRVNGHEEVRLSGALYFGMLKKFGIVIKDGLMPIVFNPFSTAGRTVGDEDAYNMGTLGLKSLEVIIIPTAGLGTDVVLGRVRAVVLPNQPRKFVLSMKRHNFSGLDSSTEEFGSVTMDKSHGHLIMLDIHERANIDKLTFNYRSVDLIREATPVMIDELNANQILPWDVDGTNITLNFCRGGRLAGMLEAEGGKATITLNTGASVASSVSYVAVRGKAIVDVK